MQRVLLLSLLFSCCHLVYGQFSIEASEILGGNSLDEAIDIALNPDSSHIFLGGRTFSTDGDIPDNEGGSDFWIIKRDLEGNEVWSRNYGGFNNDDLASILPHPDGGVIAFGTTRNDHGSFGDLTGLAGAWIMRTNPFGILNAGKIFGGVISENAIDAVRGSNGIITLAIEASSPTLDGQENNGIFDVWIVQVDNILNQQWTILLGGTLHDSPAAITTDNEGNIYVAANSQSDLPELDENKGGNDIWVFKLSPSGTLLWQKTFGGSQNDLATDILVGPDGRVYVTAQTASNDGDFNASYGLQDIWLLKINPANGALINSYHYGGSGNDQNAIISSYGRHHLILSATSNSDSVDLSGNKGFNDVWLAQLDLNGNIRRQMNYGGSLNDFSGDIVITDSVFYLLNTSLSNDKNVPPNTISQQDIWYMELDANAEPCTQVLLCRTDTTLSNELFPPANEELICVGGCNAGLGAGPTFTSGGCGSFPDATAFYKLTTDTTADLLTLSVTSDEFNKPRIGLLISGNCSSFIQVECATGADGHLLMPYIEVDPQKTYIVAVSDAEGNEGRFELCVTSIDVEFCNNKDRLYVNATSMGSPLAGPFLPGEEVQICYEIQDWNKLDCNAFQGLVPTFGPGWDPEGFDAQGQPIQIDSMLMPIAPGFWDWYDVGEVRYNVSNPVAGYTGGQGMPAGWYFTNTGDTPPNDGPDQTTGDIIHCLTTLDMWKLCFTLPVVDECEENMDVSVSMRTFSDGELGVNTSLACAYDQEETMTREMVCCINPTLQPVQEFSVCSGDTIILYPETNILPPVTYSWVSDPDIGIEGAASGTDLNRFFQILNNTTNTTLSVNYILWAEGVMCEADPITFTINVAPKPSTRIEIEGPNIVCSGSTITLNFESTGTPPFAIELLRDNQFFANILSEEPFISIDIDPVFSGRFRVGDVQDAFCHGDGIGFVNVTVKPVGSNFIDSTICAGNSVIIGTEIISTPGTHMVTLQGAAENNCDSVVTLALTVVESMTEFINEEICQGDTVFVLGVPYTQPTEETIEYTGPEGCTHFIELTISIQDTFVDLINQTICSGDTLDFGGTKVFQSGTYSYLEEIEPGCFSEHILNLSVLPALHVNDLEIIGDNGNESGAILVEITGGSPPYQYLWSNGQVSGSLFNVTHGNYSLTVTDDQGCTEIFHFTVPMVTSTDHLSDIQSVYVWPNLLTPGQSAVIYCGSGAISELEWWNISGQKIWSASSLIKSGDTFIIPDHITQGVYLIRLVTSENKKAYWQRIVIQ